MKNTLSSIIILVILQFFIGCAINKPNIPTPQYSIKQNDKIGFIIKSNYAMVHTHIGNFSGLDKPYPKVITKEVITKIINTELKAKTINLSNDNFKDINNLIIPQNNKWTIGSKTLYDKYTQMGLQAILIIEEKPILINVAPFFTVPSSGFASTKVMGMHRYFGVSGYTYSLVLLNPIGKRNINTINNFKILRDPMLNSFEEKSGLKNIENFERISDKELLIIKKNIIKLTHENIKKINSYLSN